MLPHCRKITRLVSHHPPSLPNPTQPNSAKPISLAFTLQNTCDPKWNEPLSFVLPSNSLVDAQLSLRIIGKQKLRDDLSLGRVELPLAGISTAATTGRGEVGGWFELMDGQGRLKIVADLVTRRPSLIV